MLDRMSTMPPLDGSGSVATPRRILGIAIGLSLLMTSGCAAYRPSESGYLGDYSGLRKDPFHLNRGLGLERARSRSAPAEAVAGIDSYYIEPVQWLVPDSNRASRNPARRDNFCTVLGQSLREELGRLKPIVEVPGPRTARVRSAITVVNLARPVLNLALIATVVSPVIVGPIFGGSGVVEIEAIGPDGTQVAAVSCASSGGPLDLLGYYNKSGHVRKAMKRAAHEMEETLEGR